MQRSRLLAALGACACAMLFAIPALAIAPSPGPSSSRGDANAGDVWVDTSSGPSPMFGVDAAGPGHEQDSHLPCLDVGIFAAKMADPTGSFTVFSWPPTGNQTQVYSGTWTYTAGSADPQEIALIPVSALVPVGHFKLEVSQDPSKFKTFWIDCASTSPAGPVAGNHAGGKVPHPWWSGQPGPFGAVLSAVTGGSGTVLAMTGTPIGLLLVGLVLLLGGLGFYAYRRFAGRTVRSA